ncbi:MAG TPA: hypothetical protein P5328_00255 [Candidatus Paceibacterota bacterium]|nr:hypothetical protein [Candidatus Paceibacterota bacterium]HRZ34241.1 hypothetical protein [Candidatus Paceibacterota bacterium]
MPTLLNKRIVLVKWLLIILVACAFILPSRTSPRALAQVGEYDYSEYYAGDTSAASAASNPDDQAVTRDELRKEKRGWFSEIYTGFVEGIQSIILFLPKVFKQLCAWVLFAAGTILNASVILGIMKMGYTITNSEAIRLGWSVFRDVINILFIFGLLYISILTIVSGWTENIRKRLGMVIMAALLINFSFFFTTVLIDISNILALSFYDKMTGCDIPTETLGAKKETLEPLTSESKINRVEYFTDGGLSNCLVNKLQLSGAYKPNSGMIGNNDSAATDILESNQLNLGQKILGYIAIGVVLLIVAVVLFSVSAVIFSRFITLIFLLILSPIMFGGWILPKLEEHTKSWSKKLSEQLISLPVMFLMLYITYEISGGLLKGTTTFVSTDNALSIATQNDTSTIGIFINLIIVLGFIIGSVMIGKKLGAVGAEFGAAIGAGGIAAVGRGTFGRVGAALSAVGQREGAGKIARSLGRVGDWASKRSFDIRQAAGAKAGLKGAGLDFGKPAKGADKGYAGLTEERVKEDLKLEKERDKFRRPEDRQTDDNIKKKAGDIAKNRQEYRDETDKIKQAQSKIDSENQSTKDNKAKLDQVDAEIAALTVKLQKGGLSNAELTQTQQEMNRLTQIKTAAQNSIGTSGEEIKKQEGLKSEAEKAQNKMIDAAMEQAVKSLGGKYAGARFNPFRGNLIHRTHSNAAVQARLKQMKKSERDKLKEEMAKEMREEIKKEDKEEKSGGGGDNKKK